MTYKIYLLVPLLWIAAVGAKEVRYQKNGRDVFKIAQDKKRFEISSYLGRSGFALDKCSRPIADAFWKRFSGNMAGLAQTKTKDGALNMDGKRFKVPAYARARGFLSTLPYQVSALNAEVQAKCSRSRTPAQVDPYAIGTKLQRIDTALSGKCTTCSDPGLHNPDTDKKEEWKACVQAICEGSMDQVPDIFADSFGYIFATAKTSEGVNSLDELLALDPKLEAIEKESLSLLASHFPDPSKSEFSGDEMFAMDFLLDTASRDLNPEWTMKDGKPVLEVKPIFMASLEYKNLNPAQAEALKNYVQWKEERKFQMYGASENALDAMIKVTGISDPKLATQKMAANALAMVEELKAKGISMPSVSREFLTEAAKTGDLSAEEVETLTLSYVQVANTHDLQFNPEVRQRMIAAFKGSFSVDRMEVEKQRNWDMKTMSYGLLSGASDDCKKGMNAGLSYAPSKEQIADTKKRIAEAVEGMEGTLLQRFSQQTRESLKTASKSWAFRLPPTPEELKAGIDRMVKEKVAQISTLKPSMQVGQNAAILNSIFTICDQGRSYRPLSDATYTTTGKIMVSPTSMKYPGVGDSVIRHEMGHMVSSFFQGGKSSAHSAQTFKDVRSCLAQKHPGETTSDLRVGSDVVREAKATEEDWADLAYVTMAPKSPVNMWCGGYKGDESFHSYDLKTSDNDVHSSILFRLLHTEFTRAGKLPEACKAPMKDLKFDFGRCL